MKSIISLIFSLVMFSQLNAQNMRGIEPFAHCLILDGLLFNPKDTESNKHVPNSKYCTLCVNIFHIGGLQLSEKLFLDLHLKQKDVIRSKTCYSYNYKNNDTLNCIDTLNLFITLGISIKLNGIELKPSEKEIVLNKINMDQLKAIKSKRNIFGKATIEITTR